MKPFTVIATAILEPGAITQRVSEVLEPSEEARELIEQAKQIHDRRHRRAVRKNAERDRQRGFCCIGISVYPDDLADMDEAIEDLKASGRTDMSRSKLLRIAFRKLDLAALASERAE